MTSAEFKKLIKEFNLARPNTSDAELEYVYRTWEVKAFYTDIKTKHLDYTRDNGLHLYSMGVDEFKELLTMNMELVKMYKVEKKLAKMNEDFI